MSSKGKPKRKRQKTTNEAKKVGAYDPIHTAIRARFVPFDTEKGIASPMNDGRPAQKFMAKAQTQIALAAGQGFCFMACPNISSNSNVASVLFAVGAFTGGQFTTDGFWRNATVGDQVGPFGQIIKLTTNTPYSSATLIDSNTVA